MTFQDVGTRLQIPSYGLHVMSANVALLFLLCSEKGFTYEDESTVINVPGLPPLTHRHLPLSARQSPPFTAEFRKRWPKGLREFDAILVNTCTAVEARSIDNLRSLVGC
jgi:hypothetical protein